MNPSRKGKSTRILVVDDELSVRDSLTKWFRDDGYIVGAAADANEALKKLQPRVWDIIFLDIKLPDIDGLELQQRIKSVNPYATIIMITAYATVDTAVKSLKAGAYEYVTKPVDPDYLPYLVADVVHHSVEQGMGCLLCHELKEGTFVINRKMDCFSCHHPMEGNSCEGCHKIQSRIFSGEGVLDYDTTPDVMYSSLGCTDCHVELERGKAKEIVRASCENCHDEGYTEMMDQWQKEVNARVDSIKRKIESLKEALGTLERSKGYKETEELLKSALEFSEMRLNLVEKDGSEGGHNYTLISKMLEEAALKLENTERLVP